MRYARHHSLVDFDQAAVQRAAARLTLLEPATLIAGAYLAAAGVGTLVVPGATDAQRDDLATHGPDTRVVTDGAGRDVVLAPAPTWWPGDDDLALAYWRGASAATRWLATCR